MELYVKCIYRVGQKNRGHLVLRLVTLFSKVDSNKLRINVKNKMTLIDAKFDADLINISEVTSRKTKWPRFFGLPCRVIPKSKPVVFTITLNVTHKFPSNVMCSLSDECLITRLKIVNFP